MTQGKIYTPSEIISFMDSVKNIYTIVRLVDPEECRVLTVDEDGGIHIGEQCYAAWGADERCADCISFRASHSQKPMSKTKFCHHRNFHITSTPICIETKKRRVFCSLELGTEEVPEDEPAVIPALDSNSAEYLLTHDILTRLLNTEGFFRKVRQSLIDHPDGHYAILAGNIKSLKTLNSMYGRAYGDSIIIKLAEEISKKGSREALFARDMADGILVFDRMDAVNTDRISENLSELQERFSTKDFLFAMHVGMYEIMDRSIPVAQMVNYASLAMRSIGNSSEQKIAAFTDEMMEHEIREHQVISAFDQTLEEGRFLMYLQPQVDAKGNFLGAEALVRVRERDGKITLPASFIGILEKSEQISRLDRYIWECAAAKLAEWRESSSRLLRDAYISVNVSPGDLYAMNVPDTICRICRKYKVHPSKLHVEITETSIMDDLNNRTDNIKRLQEMGFTVEIDDFGKGASSLALLGRSNADVLKVDREFVRNIRESDKDYYIMKSVMGLTGDIGMNSIIEGVETKEQLELLSSLGCSVFQGFYFAKPMPPEELEKELESKTEEK